jgi:UDP-GlcNAc:undecaprenyl-phosphate GlcNAc-1-phosphate transferase
VGDPVPALIAFALAAVLTPLVGLGGRALGLVDRPTPDPLKVHARPVPFTGGLAVIAATIAALAILGRSPRALVVAAVVVSLIVGTIDDIRPLPPWLRLVLQLAVGIAIGVALPIGVEGPVGVAITAFVAMATVNAINLLDGQDGLAGGVSMLAALALAFVLDAESARHAGAAGLALAGGLAGFLLWNRPPAWIFLGNGGAYAVGAALAALAASAGRVGGFQGAVAAGICLGLPALELILTVARRLRSGTRLASGDRHHTYDLVTRRIGVLRSTLVFCAVGAVLGVLGVLAAHGSLVVALLILGVVALGGIAAGLWLWADAGTLRQPR